MLIYYLLSENTIIERKLRKISKKKKKTNLPEANTTLKGIFLAMFSISMVIKLKEFFSIFFFFFVSYSVY